MKETIVSLGMLMTLFVSSMVYRCNMRTSHINADLETRDIVTTLESVEGVEND